MFILWEHPLIMRTLKVYKGIINKMFINSFINVLGLCGFYNNDKDDDLMLRNGTIFSGEGSNRGEQPKEFNLDWRLTIS